MKNFILVVLAFLTSWPALAQTFQVDTIFKNGGLNERINLVFVGDGYQGNELAKYRTDVENILIEIFNQSPFKEYKNYFNAFAINVISNQSGANHPQTSPDSDCIPVPVLTVDTYFGSTFDFVNIHRLLAPTKISVLSSVLADHLPQYDHAFVVVNSLYYGGSGGHYATGSIHPSGKKIAIHEIGHSFAFLADEYWAGSQYAAEKPNMTQQTNSSLVKWKNWIGVNDIGIYSHEESASWKRPHQSCKMRYSNYPFCKVCGETLVERIHSLVKPLIGYSPGETTKPVPETGTIEFSLNLIKPEPNTIKITWENNNVLFSRNSEMISVPISSFGEGAIIRATIVDTTQLTRNSVHETSHVYVVEWTIGEVVTDVPITSVESRYAISVFPNPSYHELKISYILYKSEPVTISIYDVAGRKIKTLVKQKQPAGEHSYQWRGDEIFTGKGEYILEFKASNAILTKKVIKK